MFGTLPESIFNQTSKDNVMEHELVDRAEVIQRRILQLRDSL
jgi:hypothetical protein